MGRATNSSEGLQIFGRAAKSSDGLQKRTWIIITEIQQTAHLQNPENMRSVSCKFIYQINLPNLYFVILTSSLPVDRLPVRVSRALPNLWSMFKLAGLLLY